MKKLLPIILIVLIAKSALAVEYRRDLMAKFWACVGEGDTSTRVVPDTVAVAWAQLAQDKIVRLGGYLKKTYTFVYTGLPAYPLPADFKYQRGVKIFSASVWKGALPNEQLLRDTGTWSYDIWWKNVDTAGIYVKGRFTIGDSVRVEYLGRARALSTDDVVLEFSSDDEVYVIDEMVAMYEKWNHDYQTAMLLQQQNRNDMGLGSKK